MANIIQDHIEQIQHLMRTYGVTHAYAFGSAATNQMHADSDVDLVVRFDTELDLETYGNNYFELMYALQDLLERDVDLVAEETITNKYLMQNISSQKLNIL